MHVIDETTVDDLPKIPVEIRPIASGKKLVVGYVLTGLTLVGAYTVGKFVAKHAADVLKK